MQDTNDDAVEQYLNAIENADMKTCDAFVSDVTLDATVPNWRFSVHGADAVRSELSGWFALPGRFDELKRTALPTGELVEFTLRWEEDGVPFAVHQAHILEVADGRIIRDQAWCGGRWSATLLAAMAGLSDAHA
jgi:ketosteroid isomerase-like protein